MVFTTGCFDIFWNTCIHTISGMSDENSCGFERRLNSTGNRLSDHGFVFLSSRIIVSMIEISFILTY